MIKRSEVYLDRGQLMKLLFVAALWALCAVTAAAAAPGGVRTISAADVDALLHDVAELKGTISALNAELADELRLAREHAAAEAARAAAAAAPEAHTHRTLPVDTPARRRLQASAPEIAISVCVWGRVEVFVPVCGGACVVCVRVCVLCGVLCVLVCVCCLFVCVVA